MALAASTKPFDYRAKGDALWLKGSLDYMQETTRCPQLTPAPLRLLSTQERPGANCVGHVGRAPPIKLGGTPNCSALTLRAGLQKLEREQEAELDRYRDEHVSVEEPCASQVLRYLLSSGATSG